MPVRPDELIKVKDEPILNDRSCAACGYNLRGLRTSGKCPECGKSIHKPRNVPRYADQMVQAPLWWLKGYALGTLLLCIGGWAMALGLLGWSWTTRPECGGVALLGAIAWTLGAFLTTRPRPKTEAIVINPDQEWKTLRIWARASQPLWILGIGIGVTAQAANTASWLMVASALACVGLGMIGWWPLLIIQSNLAYWASDTDLAIKMRNGSWGLAAGLMIGAGVLFVMGQSWAGSLIGSLLFLGAWFGVICVSLGYVLIALWQLWRMAHWVTLNHISSDLKDERLRARARRAMPPRPAGAAQAKRG